METGLCLPISILSFKHEEDRLIFAAGGLVEGSNAFGSHTVEVYDIGRERWRENLKALPGPGSERRQRIQRAVSQKTNQFKVE